MHLHRIFLLISSQIVGPFHALLQTYVMIFLNFLWFFCAGNFFPQVSTFFDVTFILGGGYLFVLSQKSGSLESGSDHLALLFYHFSPNQIIMCIDLSVFYTIKNVFHFLVNHCGCQTEPQWQSEEQCLLTGIKNVQKCLLKAPARNLLMYHV